MFPGRAGVRTRSIGETSADSPLVQCSAPPSIWGRKKQRCRREARMASACVQSPAPDQTQQPASDIKPGRLFPVKKRTAAHVPELARRAPRQAEWCGESVRCARDPANGVNARQREQQDARSSAPNTASTRRPRADVNTGSTPAPQANRSEVPPRGALLAEAAKWW